MDELSRICQFNEHPSTIFVQKLLDYSYSGLKIPVPECFRPLMGCPTNIENHHNLTRELIEHYFVPTSDTFNETIKRHINRLRYDDNAIFESDIKFKVDSSFWYLVLNPHRGDPNLYTWEHLLMREALDDYLIRLTSLFTLCPKTLPKGDIKNCMDHIFSLNYLTAPIRFNLGPHGTFGTETLMNDYVHSYHPLLSKYFKWKEEGKEDDDEDDEDDELNDFVKGINPLVIETNFPRCVKISKKEKDIIYNPKHKLDISWTEDQGFSIFWWFPDCISINLDNYVIENKEKFSEADKFV